MTKSDLIRWLKSEKEKTKQAAVEKFNNNVRENKADFDKICNIEDAAENINSYFDLIRSELELFLKRVESNKGYRTEGYYDSLSNYLNNYFCDIVSIESVIHRSFEYPVTERKIRHNRNVMENEIEKNYNNVINNVKQSKTANDAAEYLKKLGFSIPSFDKECTMIAVPVDTSFLFVKDDGNESL